MSHFVQSESFLRSYSDLKLHALVMIESVLVDHPVLEILALSLPYLYIHVIRVKNLPFAIDFSASIACSLYFASFSFALASHSLLSHFFLSGSWMLACIPDSGDGVSLLVLPYSLSCLKNGYSRCRKSGLRERKLMHYLIP